MFHISGNEGTAVVTCKVPFLFLLFILLGFEYCEGVWMPDSLSYMLDIVGCYNDVNSAVNNGVNNA